MFFPISYQEPLFRPPSEAYSLILQPTIGCSWNRCAFCEMYTTKKFKIRDIAEVKAEIKAMKAYGDQVKKVFLADGNAMALPAAYLQELLNELHDAFQATQKIIILKQRIAGHLMLIRKSTWQKIRTEVFLRCRTQNKKILGVDTQISYAILAAGLDIKLMQGIYLIHNLRILQGMGNTNHLL